MSWIEFLGIYFFGIVTGIFLFGAVCVFYCLDGNKIIMQCEERRENGRNKNNK